MIEPQPDFFVDDDVARGRLIATNLASIPFSVSRVFFVSAPGRPVTRGGHVTTCHEVICVLSGSVLIRRSVMSNNTVEKSEHLLSDPGDSLIVSEGMFIEYDLQTSNSEILVFASAEFEPTQLADFTP